MINDQLTEREELEEKLSLFYVEGKNKELRQTIDSLSQNVTIPTEFIDKLNELHAFYDHACLHLCTRNAMLKALTKRIVLVNGECEVRIDV